MVQRREKKKKKEHLHWRYCIFDANNSFWENTREKKEKKKENSLKKKKSWICKEEELKVSISQSKGAIRRMKNLGCLLLYL